MNLKNSYADDSCAAVQDQPHSANQRCRIASSLQRMSEMTVQEGYGVENNIRYLVVQSSAP